MDEVKKRPTNSHTAARYKIGQDSTYKDDRERETEANGELCPKSFLVNQYK